MIGYVCAGFESALLNNVKISKDANLISCVTSFFIVETNSIFVFICVAENKNNNKVVILLGKMHPQSYFLLKLDRKSVV